MNKKLYWLLLISQALLLFAQPKDYQEGEVNFQIKKFREAIPYFQKVLAERVAKEYYEKASLRLGQCYLAIEDLQNARKYFTIASWQKGDIGFQGSLGLALCDIQEGKYEEAIEKLTSLIAQEPERKTLAYAFYDRGIAYERKGWSGKAINDFQEAITRGYDDESLLASAKAHLSASLSAYRQFQEEEQTYLKRIEQATKPDLIRDLYHELAKRCADIGEMEKAIDYEKRSLNYSSDENYNAGAWMNIAWRFAINKDYEKAAEAFKKVFEEYPQTQYAREALLRAGDMYSFAKKMDEAIKHYEKFVKLYPDDPKVVSAYLDIAWRYVDKAREMSKQEENVEGFEQRLEKLRKIRECYEKAGETFETIADKFPDSPYAPEALLRAGDVYMQANSLFYESGQTYAADAINCYTRLIEDYPQAEQVPNALMNLAWIYRGAGRAEKEAETLLELNKRFPNSELGWFALGLYYEKEGEVEKALECYKKAADFYGPQRAISLLNILGRYYDLGNYKEAIRTFQTFWEEYGDRDISDLNILIEAIWYTARAYEHIFDYEKAIKQYSLLCEKLNLRELEQAVFTPIALRSMLRIGYCYLQTGDYERAFNAWKKPPIGEARTTASLLNCYRNILKPTIKPSPPPAGSSSIGVIGTIGDLGWDFKEDFRRGRTVIVIGTLDESPGVNSAYLEAGETVQRFRFEKAKIQSDTEITEEEAKENNLVILGNPSSNKFFASIKDKLPIKVEGLKIRVADRTYSGKNIGLVMLVPNPFNEKKFALIWCAFDPAVLKYIVHFPSDDENVLEPMVDYMVMAVNPEGNLQLHLEEGYFMKLSPSNWKPW
ncbi:MAG: outer membrane protein assembly factor BamD [bacterium]